MNTIRDAIKRGLRDRNIKQVDLAQVLAVSPVSINNVISGKKKNPRIRKAIAMAIGCPVSKIWPETEKKGPSPGRTTGSMLAGMETS